MKKIPFLLLSVLTLPVHAQSVLSILTRHQDSLQTPQSQTGSSTPGTVTSSTPEVKPSVTSASSASIQCASQDQTSLPLAYITSLIQEKNGHLNITHYQETGRLEIKSGDMIGNCSSMIEWTVKEPVIQGKKAYAIEAKIKKGDRCNDATNECVYLVSRSENGEFKTKDEMVFKPTLKGFDECLKRSGVITDGKINQGAIYNDPINASFEGLNTSAKLLFVSNGPDSKQIKPKYDKNFEFVNGCDHYESAHPNVKELLTAEDAERRRLEAEAAKLRECKVEEYGKLTEFIDKYESYQSELGQLRDRLILEAAKKTAINIEKGKVTPEDTQVIKDFDQYIVQPKVDLARSLYEELLDLEGDARTAKEQELVKVLREISELNKAPFFTTAHVRKLLDSGKFDEATTLNTAKLILENHQRLGANEQGTKITPGYASNKIRESVQEFKESVEEFKKEYLMKTGQSAPISQNFTNTANNQRAALQVYIQEEQMKIAQWQQQMQYGGYCYAYYRNTQKCLQNAAETIQRIQSGIVETVNKTNQTIAANENLAKKWSTLEAEGRRYIAAQRGEELPKEPETPETPPTTPVPVPEMPGNNGAYTFQWNGQQQQGNPQMPQQQNPYMQQSPYGYYNQQQPQYMGQQNYNSASIYGPYAQGGYNFNWSAGQQQPMQYGYQQPMYGYQQQQMPYYNNPYQAYGNYSFYGQQRW